MLCGKTKLERESNIASREEQQAARVMGQFSPTVPKESPGRGNATLRKGRGQFSIYALLFFRRTMTALEKKKKEKQFHITSVHIKTVTHTSSSPLHCEIRKPLD